MRSKGPRQAPRYPISSENTKSSVLHKENLHFSGAMHSILHLISPPCGPTNHREPHSELPLRLRVSIGALVKTLAGIVPEAYFRPVPWLIQCDETCQTSLDFSRSLLFNRGRRVSMSTFWSSNCSSASFVSLKPWIPQFS